MTTVELVARSSSVTKGGNSDLVAVAERARQGDRAAWHEIVLRFDGSLRRIARAHGLDEPTCGDVVQQTWLSAFSKLRALRRPEALSGWLYAIARRESRLAVTCRNLDTRRLRQIDSDADSVESYFKIRSELPAPEIELLRAEQRTLLRRAWRQLPRRDQELLTLLMDEPRRPYAEISRHTGLPVGSIGPTRARSLARLRARLAALGVNHRWSAA